LAHKLGKAFWKKKKSSHWQRGFSYADSLAYMKSLSNREDKIRIVRATGSRMPFLNVSQHGFLLI
jgi:hypothetical protein